MTAFSLIRGRVLRATRLDGCGNPVLGPDSVVTTKGFISVGLTANNVEGEAISVTNANGDICIADTPAPKFTGYGVEIALCGVEPELVNLFTNQPLVMADGATPAAVGFRINSGIDVDSSGFAIELWSGVPAAACEPGTGQSYGYLLIPFLKGGTLGDFTIENAAVNFTITGAQSKDGSSWGVGPFNVVKNATGVSSPLLTPIDVKDHLHVELTTVAPPTEAEGATALGVPATGATAGIPATLTPTNSYAPANFAAMATAGVTASPATVWTTGQYLLLRDGSHTYWSGTAWVAGEAA